MLPIMGAVPLELTQPPAQVKSTPACGRHCRCRWPLSKGSPPPALGGSAPGHEGWLFFCSFASTKDINKMTNNSCQE